MQYFKTCQSKKRCCGHVQEEGIDVEEQNRARNYENAGYGKIGNFILGLKANKRCPYLKKPY